MNIGLYHRRVHAQLPAADHFSLACQVDQSRQHLLQDVPVEQVRESDERLCIRHSLAVDAAESAVHQASPNFTLALVEAPVVEVLQHEHPQHHLGRSARTTFLPAAWPATSERIGHQVDELVILEDLVDSTQGGIPQLVRVRQQYFEHASLPVLA